MNSRDSTPAAPSDEGSCHDSAAATIKESLEVLVNQLSGEVRSELDALRAGLDKHIAAVAASFATRDYGKSLETLVVDLSKAAAEQAEAAATRARRDSQEAAQAELAAARAAAQQQRDAESAAQAALHESLDDARKQLDTMQADAATLQAAHREIESRLRQAESGRTELGEALATAQRETIDARREVEARTGSLDRAHAQLEALEQEHAQLQQARDELAVHLAAESRERMTLTEALEAARQAATIAKANTERSRDEVEAATRYALTMKEERERLAGQLQALIDAGDAAGVELAALDRVNLALRALDQATTQRDVLDTLLLQLGHEFARAAIFVVAGNCLKGWRSRGLDATTTIDNLAIPLTVASPLTRAMTEERPVTQLANPDQEQVGVFGSAIDCAIAVPILVEATVVAVAYGERLQPAQGAGASLRIAEMLGGHTGRRLAAIGTGASAERPASAPTRGDTRRDPGSQVDAGPPLSRTPTAPDPSASYPGPTRAAHRVTLPEGSEIVVDSTACLLVNLSSRGAQIRSPRAMRPNHVVRIMLPKEEGTLPCKGRIVWAVFEMPRSGEAARYRAGLQFTDVDQRALEAFLLQCEHTASTASNNVARC
jgi:hypothetical protein